MSSKYLLSVCLIIYFILNIANNNSSNADYDMIYKMDQQSNQPPHIQNTHIQNEFMFPDQNNNHMDTDYAPSHGDEQILESNIETMNGNIANIPHITPERLKKIIQIYMSNYSNKQFTFYKEQGYFEVKEIVSIETQKDFLSNILNKDNYKNYSGKLDLNESDWNQKMLYTDHNNRRYINYKINIIKSNNIIGIIYVKYFPNLTQIKTFKK